MITVYHAIMLQIPIGILMVVQIHAHVLVVGWSQVLAQSASNVAQNAKHVQLTQTLVILVILCNLGKTKMVIKIVFVWTIIMMMAALYVSHAILPA